VEGKRDTRTPFLLPVVTVEISAMSPRAKAELNAQKKTEREREKGKREIRCDRANRIRNSRQEPEDFAGSPEICPEIKLDEFGTRSTNFKSQRRISESSASSLGRGEKKKKERKKKEKSKEREGVLARNFARGEGGGKKKREQFPRDVEFSIFLAGTKISVCLGKRKMEETLYPERASRRCGAPWTNGPPHAVHEGPMHVRVHIRGTLNQAAFVARELGRWRARGRASPAPRGRRKCTRSPFFCSEQRPRSFLPSSFCSASSELPGATETDVDAFIIRFRLARFHGRAADAR